MLWHFFSEGASCFRTKSTTQHGNFGVQGKGLGVTMRQVVSWGRIWPIGRALSLGMMLLAPSAPSLAQGCPEGCPDADCSTLTECDFGGVPKNPCVYPGTDGCADNYLPGNHCCCWNSPIIFDVDGRGYHLTGPRQGVLFDIVGKGVRSWVAWPAEGSTNAWLVLDRNGNGLIDNIKEMFGNRTVQPPPPLGQKRNGFLALAVFDTPREGGNWDGVLDARDVAFTRLRLWQDLNRNGMSEAIELKPLVDFGITGIDLTYKAAFREDGNGNKFVLRAKVFDSRNSGGATWCWDVVPGTLPPDALQ